MRFLLVKLNHIGDTLLMTPTIRWIRQQYPDAIIHVVVRKGCEVVLQGNPDINELIALAKPEKSQRTKADSKQARAVLWRFLLGPRYDCAFDLSDSDRAKILVLASRAKIRGVNAWHGAKGLGKLFNRYSDFAWGSEHQVLKDFRTVTDCLGHKAQPGPLVLHSSMTDDVLKAALPQWDAQNDFVLLHPVSRWAFKEWHVQSWREIIQWLNTEYGLNVVLSCGPDAREVAVTDEIAKGLNHVISTQGKLSLDKVAALLKRAKLYLGVDTAVMHMSAALQVPSVVLFGPSSEWSWAPWQVKNELVLADCNCKRTRKFVCDKSKIYPCMAGVAVDQVQSAVQKVLAKEVSKADVY